MKICESDFFMKNGVSLMESDLIHIISISDFQNVSDFLNDASLMEFVIDV